MTANESIFGPLPSLRILLSRHWHQRLTQVYSEEGSTESHCRAICAIADKRFVEAWEENQQLKIPMIQKTSELEGIKVGSIIRTPENWFQFRRVRCNPAGAWRILQRIA